MLEQSVAGKIMEIRTKGRKLSRCTTRINGFATRGSCLWDGAVDYLVAIAFYMGRDAAYAFVQAMANNHDANHSRLTATGHLLS